MLYTFILVIFQWVKHLNPILQYYLVFCFLMPITEYSNINSSFSLPSTDNPARPKGENRKPPIAQKPSKTISHSSPSTSPPLPRRRSEDICSPSPPPPPPPPHSSGQKRLDMAVHSEYVMLEHTSTLDPLGMFILPTSCIYIVHVHINF